MALSQLKRLPSKSTSQYVLAIRYNSYFEGIKMGPPDAIFGLTEAYKKDKDPKKINLGAGAYRDDDGKPFVLPSVRMAEEKIYCNNMNHEYAAITGIAEFCKLASEMAFGKDSKVLKNQENATAQTLGGTGALRVGGGFLGKFFCGSKDIYVPNPTWGNHKNIFTQSGLTLKTYRYFDPKTVGLDFKGMTEDLCCLPEGSIVLLHAVAHNPTGVDPDKNQWNSISKICKDKRFFVFFDMAYQGFATGDLEADGYAVKRFVEDGHKIMLAQSYSKNMGLYGERVGALTILGRCKEERDILMSQLKIMIRGMYSNPPIFGGRVVTEILSDECLKQQWLKDVQGMACRIISAREQLVEALKKVGSKRKWDHITKQIGMFCYTGLNKEQVKKMVSEHHVYMTGDGRISIAGVGSKNVEALGKAMHEVTK